MLQWIKKFKFAGSIDTDILEKRGVKEVWIVLAKVLSSVIYVVPLDVSYYPEDSPKLCG